MAQTRFSVSTLVRIVEFIPAAHFLSRIVSRRSNGGYEHYLAWELDYSDIVLTIEGWCCQDRRLGNVQGTRNMDSEQKSHQEQTRLIDLDESVGAKLLSVKRGGRRVCLPKNAHPDV